MFLAKICFKLVRIPTKAPPNELGFKPEQPAKHVEAPDIWVGNGGIS